MTPIIDNTVDIKEFISVNVNIDFSTLSPYVDNALVEFLQEPWLGDDIVDDIETNVATATGVYPKLVKLTQRCLTYFSILKALPFLEVNIGDDGITRPHGENMATAYRGQIERIETQLKTDAYNALERLLAYLEKDKVGYPMWTDAPGYIEFSNYFFKDSKEFSYHYTLVHGRLTYKSLLQSMRYVTEFNIKAEIGADQLADFFSKKNDSNNTPEYVQAYEYLKPAIANLTVAQALIDGWVTYTSKGVHFNEDTEDTKKQTNATAQQLSAKINSVKDVGETYLSKLVDYMNNNLDEFVPFRDDESITKADDDDYKGVGGITGGWSA